MKRLLIILFFSSTVLFAQDESINGDFKQHKLSFNIGGSSPQSAYKKTNTDDDAGFAESGMSFRFTYEYRIDESKAATFLIGRIRNSFASEIFTNRLDQLDGVDSIRWNTTADDYQLGFGMVGIKLMHGEAVRIYVNPMLGFASLTSPEVRIRTRFPSGIIVNQTVRESDPASALMLGVSAGVDMDLSDNVNLNFDVLYLTSEFDLTAQFETFDSNGNPDVVIQSGSQPYSTLNISVGIGVNF